MKIFLEVVNGAAPAVLGARMKTPAGPGARGLALLEKAGLAAALQCAATAPSPIACVFNYGNEARRRRARSLNR